MADKLATVKALLAKAEDPGVSEAEAEAYSAKAFELMALYGIEDAVAQADRPGPSEGITSITVPVTNPRKVIKDVLLAGITRAMRCEAVMMLNRVEAEVYGYPEDLERVRITYESLTRQLMARIETVRPRHHGEELRSYRRSWGLGFANRVGQRIAEREERALKEMPTTSSGKPTEIVLADRATAVQAHVRRQIPVAKVTTARSGGSGYKDGQAAGSRANIGFQ